MTLPAEDPQPLVLRLQNRIDEISRLEDAIEAFGEKHGLGPKTMHALQLALEEVVTNVISYAWIDGGVHELGVSITLQDTDVVARVEDDGQPFDPLVAPPPDLDVPFDERVEGGLGIYLARHYMDDLAYRREGSHNVMSLRKTRAD